jgi:DNA-binding NarL/FixJ family response regulator
MSPPAVIRVLVADDQRVVREGLVMLLGLLGGIEVAGAAADGEQAVALATELRPHAVLMDLRMPRVDGVAATRRLRERDPGIKVLALTTYDDERSVVEALRAGARGYLTKDAGAEQIRQALEAVVRGEAAIDPAVQHHLVDALATAAPATTGTLPGRPDAARGRGAVADRRRALQRRDRRPPDGQRGHRQEPHQPPVHQDRRPRPRPGGRLRLPPRPRPPAGVLTARSRPARR